MKKSKFLFLFNIFITLMLLSCSNKNEFSSSEGIIDFKINYPVKNYDASWERLIPKKMTMSFKDNVYKNEVAVGVFFNSSIITDCNKKEITMVLNLNPEKIYTRLDEKQVAEMLTNYPIPEIINTKYYDSIMGIVSKRYFGVYENLEDGRDVQLNETNQILINNSNWGNQFSEINGVLINYEVAQFGLNMQFKAQSINLEQKVPDSTFTIPKDYKEVSLDVYLRKMNDIFSAFLI